MTKTFTSASAAPYNDELYLHKRSLAVRSSLSLSPDGRLAAVTIQGLASDIENSKPVESKWLDAISEEIVGSEVLVVDLESGEITRPFQTFCTSFLPAWSPDGQNLALLTQDSSCRFPRVTLWTPFDEEPRVFEEAPMRAITAFYALRWTSDSLHIVFKASSLPSAEPLVTCLTNQTLLFEPPARESLAILEVLEGRVQIMSEMTSSCSWRISPDDRRVAFLKQAIAPLSAPATQANWYQLVVVNLEDGHEQLVGGPQTDNWGCSFSWSPDGSAIAWLGVAYQVPPRLHIADLSNAAMLHSIDLPTDIRFGYQEFGWYPPPAPLWSSENSRFFLPGNAKLWRFRRDGHIEEALPLPENAGFDWFLNSITALDFPRHRVAQEDDEVWLSRHHEVWRVNLASGAASPLWKKAQEAPPVSRYWNERAYDESKGLLYTVHESPDGRVTLFCTQLEQGVTQAVTTLWQGVGELEVGPIRYLSWNLADGTACGGSLLLPVTWKEGDKPPVVMSVYGDDRGKGALDSTRFHDGSYIINPHLLSAQGYAVFVPDMPQTDEAPLQSLVAAGEAAAGALEASGLVDMQRVAVMGSSYGGYTTLCMLVGSKRFKTGIICNGVYDMARVASDGGWGYVEAGQGRMRASLWQQPERYHENSPFYRLDQLEVPLLIVSGGGDSQGKEHDRTVFNALQRLEKPVELLAYSHQGHAPTSWTIAAQRDLHQRILAFFVTHLSS